MLTKKQKRMLTRILISIGLVLILLPLPLDGILRFALFMLPYLCVGYDILIKAGKGILRGQPFDENFLMGVATLGAILLGDYVEGVAVMLFYQIGELFQSYAVGKSRRNIGALMDIRPDLAVLEGQDGLCEVDPDEVPVGSVIVVRPGEKIPIDGVIIEGSSALNTVALTGESTPRDVQCGDCVISGCINLSGALKIRTTKEFGESTVSKILELVENASSRKSRSENFITRFARIYTPVVCFSALALALLPPLFRLLVLQGDPMWSDWIYRALTFLVISCPCALVVSIPLSFFAGLGGASREGILIKGSNYLEQLASVRTIAFDKTGTVTEGRLSVDHIVPVEIEERLLLYYAAHAEYYSTHPIAQGLRVSLGDSLDSARVRDVKEIAGRGITALIDGRSVAVGNALMMEEMGLRPLAVEKVGTAVHLAIDGRYTGYILFTDRLKDGSVAAMKELRRMGIHRTVMLTGDNETTGKAVGTQLGIDDVRCELLPADKLQILESLLQEKKAKEMLAFVGDGINDAPVLSRADVGIAMGALGSDAAIEAADVVLMDDDPRRIPLAIRISKRCIRIVRQNIVLALGIKLVCLLLGALGFANMWLAIFADVGVMVIAVLNAIRALHTRG